MAKRVVSDDIPNKELSELIDLFVRGETPRAVLKRRLIDERTFDQLCDEFGYSIQRIKTITYKAEEQLFKHIWILNESKPYRVFPIGLFLLYNLVRNEVLNDANANVRLGEIDYANFIGKKLIHDVSNELKFAERLFIELECCDYDMVYLTEIQDKYHKKFKD